MADTYTVSEAQGRLAGLLRRTEAGETIGIRRRDRTVAFLVSRERMDAMVETIELLASPDAREAIERHRGGKLAFFPLSALDADE